jgi:hypothetical protein
MMSGNSIVSLIIFVSLIAFAITGSILAMLICAGILCAIWHWRGRKKLPPHFQKLASANETFCDAAFHEATNLPIAQSTTLLAFLRHQMPLPTRAIPLRPENRLFDDLNIDPVAFELDEMPKLCKDLSLIYEIDEQNPLWERLETVNDLTTYIASLEPTP